MLCIPCVTSSTEKAFWLPSAVFKSHFDQSDFVDNRDVHKVELAYPSDWFHISDNGIRSFYIPAVAYHLNMKRTGFINCRHRTEVMWQAGMTRIPMGFEMASWAAESHILLEKLSLEPMDMTKPIDLPGLRIVDCF